MDDFTDHLRWLFDNVPDPEGRRITTERLVELISEVQPEVRISVSYANALRRGAKSNPSSLVVGAIAQAFGVPTAFFFDSALRKAIQDGVHGLTEARDSAILRLQGRIEALTDAQLMQLISLVDSFTKPEGR